MNQPTPIARAYFVAGELLPMLRTCLSYHPTPAMDRLCALHAFTRLRAVCELYAEDDDPDIAEDFYLLLFDALGFLTTAWQLPGMRRECMERAVDRLQAVRLRYQQL